MNQLDHKFMQLKNELMRRGFMLEGEDLFHTLKVKLANVTILGAKLEEEDAASDVMTLADTIENSVYKYIKGLMNESLELGQRIDPEIGRRLQQLHADEATKRFLKAYEARLQ